jgi:nitroimidazol reductase NimA-like FMN-containing flavoprotein (pyridoxamine 5'-phosphate oxidase superfamily)
MNELVELSAEKCEELLRAAIVGRVVFETEDGPQIVLVNYTTVDDAVVFRTTPYSQLGTHVDGGRLAFEIDHIDYDGHRGWSVVAHGTGEVVEDPADLAATGPFWNPKPWAAGNRLLYVRLPWRRLTGRRIGAGWTRGDELPVRRR